VEVVDRLRDLIIEGEIEPGERLHEMNLSETLNVSRTPLREALKLLASEGLVDLLPGRGARVSVLSAGGAQDLFEVVSGLERLAAELAAVRMTSRDLARLKAMHDRMSEHFAAGEKREYFALNHAIHVAIVAAAKNDTLTGTHATLMSRARRGSYAALASEARWKESMTEHEELMEALERRDAKLAGDILFTHDRHTGETIGVLLAKAPHHQGRL
jgi:DNA-binding GntR family transcriptional regulator